MMMSAGELTVRLALDDGRVSAVSILSSRPQSVASVLVGRMVDDAAVLLPRLYSICGRAHSVAAQAAVAAARGQALAPTVLHDCGQRVEAEMAHELLWRVLLDWPHLAGEAPDTATFVRARAALDSGDRGALRQLVEPAIFDGAAAQWWEHEHVPAFEIWLARARSGAARTLAAVQRDGSRHGAPALGVPLSLLPAPPAPPLLAQIDAGLRTEPAFAWLPHVDQQPAETGAVARLARHPLVAALLASYGRSSLTRLAARLTELARIACGAAAVDALVGQHSAAEAVGLGWVETARGLLVHRVELDGERVRQWQVLAPTEWNFHPRGALYQGLMDARGSQAEVQTRAQWLVHALDPCVAHRLEFVTPQAAPVSGGADHPCPHAAETDHA